MAHPDLKDGWYKLSHELDAALAIADFTKAERIVVREVFAQIYGPARDRLTSAAVSPTDVGRRTGLAKGNVGKALRSLVDGHVLAATADGRFRFLKDYEKWTREGGAGGEPRLSKVEVAWAASAPKYALSHANECDTKTGHSVLSNGITDNGTPTGGRYPTREHRVIQRDNETLSNGITNPSPPPDPPIEVLAKTTDLQTAAAGAAAGGENDFESSMERLGELFGQEVAAEVRADARRIHGEIFGRWGLFAKAALKASMLSEPRRDLIGYCMGLAKSGAVTLPVRAAKAAGPKSTKAKFEQLRARQAKNGAKS